MARRRQVGNSDRSCSFQPAAAAAATIRVLEQLDRPHGYNSARMPHHFYDAILVLGGGLSSDGRLPPWSLARFKRACELANRTRYILALSAGTPHKPPPLDVQGRPVYESAAGVQYLLSQGVKPSKLLAEAASWDTIGNAYFSRVVHAQPAGWRKLLIITSQFHIERTKAVFNWVYGLAPHSHPFELSYEATADEGIAGQALSSRRRKEAAGLASVRRLAARIRSLKTLHGWLFREHTAYAVAARAETSATAASQPWLSTY